MNNKKQTAATNGPLVNYTATFRNNSNGILFKKTFLARTAAHARERAKQWKKSWGSWCSLCGVSRG
jgi:hypothetical protein